MSNTTHESRQSGDKRRRRNRGGKNRNHQGNQSQSGNRREGGREGKPPRAEEFRPQSGSKRRPMPPPPKLTWWQKLLKALRLYKEPVRPPRPKPPVAEDAPPGTAPKSNVRNARSGQADASGSPSGEPRERKPRPPRDERREGERKPRGGNPETVESARVYVGNLSYEVSEEDLRELFAGIGKVRNVEIVYNRNTHRSKGYGFVEMIHINEARQAVEVLNDQFFMGRKMVVSGAQSKGQDERDEPEEDRERKPVVVVSAKPAAAAVVANETTHALVPDTAEAQAEPDALTETVETVETVEAAEAASSADPELPATAPEEPVVLAEAAVSPADENPTEEVRNETSSATA